MHLELAKVYIKAGNIEQALYESFYAYYLNPPQSAEDHFFLGCLFAQLKYTSSEIQAYEHALVVDPYHKKSLAMLGTVYVERGLVDRGIELLRQSLTVDEQDDLKQGIIYLTLSNALIEKGLHQEAEATYQQALESLPEAEKAWAYINHAFHQECQNKITAALDTLNQAIKADPTKSIAHENRSLALLKLGNYKDGWQGYERCFMKGKGPIFINLDVYKTPWQGEDIRGRRLLVCCDQGNGDAFQMIRYLPLLKQRGAIIILGAPPALIELLKKLPQLGVSEWAETSPPPPFDYAVSIMNLPRWFETELSTIPSTQPAWQINLPSTQRLPKTGKKFRVGLSWAGNPLYPNDKNRSMSLSTHAL
ncbi:MAG: tetratricopeptide repeat protein [Gammaproteobacteria bacterium]